MNALRAFVAAVFICMIVFGVLLYLSPKGSMSSGARITVGIALIASVIISAASAFKYDIGDISLCRPASDTNEYLSFTVDYENETVKNTVVSIIDEKLRNAGIDNASVEVITDISESGGISITKAVISCDADDLPAAENAVGDLGLPITYEGK